LLLFYYSTRCQHTTSKRDWSSDVCSSYLIQMILVVIVAFFAGMGGILDELQFHQPLVACTLIGLVTGNLTIGIMLGGSLQMIALGWANIGAAVAPDAALASVASTIILV